MSGPESQKPRPYGVCPWDDAVAVEFDSDGNCEHYEECDDFPCSFRPGACPSCGETDQDRCYCMYDAEKVDAQHSTPRT